MRGTGNFPPGVLPAVKRAKAWIKDQAKVKV
jgi:hypothetical protein